MTRKKITKKVRRNKITIKNAAKQNHYKKCSERKSTIKSAAKEYRNTTCGDKISRIQCRGENNLFT